MTPAAGERHCHALVAAQAAAASLADTSTSATVALTTTQRYAAERAGHALRRVRSNVSPRRRCVPRPGAWRDARSWDAQLVPEAAERRDRRPCSEVRAVLLALGASTTGAVGLRDLRGIRIDEAVTPP